MRLSRSQMRRLIDFFFLNTVLFGSLCKGKVIYKGNWHITRQVCVCSEYWLGIFSGNQHRNLSLAASFMANFLKISHLRSSKVEIITGQNNLNYVQSKIYPGQISELCRFCKEDYETFAHLLNECPCFLTHRREIIHNKPIIKTLKWKAKTLLKFSYIDVIDEALITDRQ